MLPRRSILFLFVCLLTAATAFASPADPPCDVGSALAAAGSAEEYPDADQLVVFDRTNIDVEPSGLSHITNHRLVKVLTDAGAARAGFQRLDYDPATQSITVRRIAVHRADGPVEEVDLAGIVDVIAPAHAIYWGARMLGVDLPRLNAGDAIEVETYRKGFQIAYLTGEGGALAPEGRTFGAGADESRYIPPMRGHYYDSVLFQEGSPLISKTYKLRTPRAMPVQYAVYNGEVTCEHTFDAEHFMYEFSRRDMPAAPHEWRSPGLSDFVPKVVMATVMDWPEKSRWFHDANVNQFDSTPEIQAKVDEITKGMKEDSAKISAINHWVAQNIRYCGFNMGEGEGYTLHPGDMVYRERAGVCKDIAGMSITMLRAAGYTVYPAMTMAGARVERTPADQFNHCVVALKKDDGTYKMLDPTWVPFSRYDWSRSEGEQHYVVGSPEGEELSAIRTYTPEENGLKVKLDAEIDADGTLRGTLRFDPSGNCDTRLRRVAGNSPLDGIEAGLRSWLATLGADAKLVKYEFGEAENWDEPLTMDVEFAVPDYAAVGENTLTFLPVSSRLVMASYAGMFRWASRSLPEERVSPALLWANAAVQVDEKLRLPKGFEAIVPTDEVKAGSEDGAGLCDFTWKADGRKLAFNGRIVAADRTITVERWDDFRAAVDAFAEIGDKPLVAWKKGGRS